MDLHAVFSHAFLSVQVIDADPNVVDADVLFCDHVLASPNVALGSLA